MSELEAIVIFYTHVEYGVRVRDYGFIKTRRETFRDDVRGALSGKIEPIIEYVLKYNEVNLFKTPPEETREILYTIKR